MNDERRHRMCQPNEWHKMHGEYFICVDTHNWNGGRLPSAGT